MRRELTRTLSVMAACTAVAGLAGTEAGVATAARATSQPVSAAPCTRAAIAAGLHRGPKQIIRGRLVAPFRCSGRVAYAAVIDGPIEMTQLLVADHGHWTTASRADYCARNAVPEAIYHGACQAN